MSRTRGRPQRNTIALTMRVSTNLVSTMKTERPELLRAGTLDFRHGALGSFIENLLWKELRGKPKYGTQSEIVDNSLAGGHTGSGRAEGGSAIGGALHGAGSFEGGLESAEGSLSSSGSGDEGYNQSEGEVE